MTNFQRVLPFWAVVSGAIDLEEFDNALGGTRSCSGLEFEADGEHLIVRCPRPRATLRLRSAAEIDRAREDIARKLMGGMPDLWATVRRLKAARA